MQHGAQISWREALYGLINQQGVLAVQIETVEVRATSVRIAVIQNLLIARNLEQTLPETLPAK
jgi:hypothetical protein